jgi:hypothetical protein
MSLVGNILQLRVLLPTPWLTLDRISLTPLVTSRICRVAIFGTWRIPDYAVEMHGSSENSPFSSFDRVTILGRVLSGVCDPSGKTSLRPQAYTACSEQTGRGFFERVCTKQRARPSQRPTPTPQRKGTGVPAPGLRPEVDHAPR